ESCAGRWRRKRVHGSHTKYVSSGRSKDKKRVSKKSSVFDHPIQSPLYRWKKRILMNKNTISGSCLCSAIQFEVGTPPICINNCHCSRCRKSSGAAFGSFFHTRVNQFKWISGKEFVN